MEEGAGVGQAAVQLWHPGQQLVAVGQVLALELLHHPAVVLLVGVQTLVPVALSPPQPHPPAVTQGMVYMSRCWHLPTHLPVVWGRKPGRPPSLRLSHCLLLRLPASLPLLPSCHLQQHLSPCHRAWQLEVFSLAVISCQSEHQQLVQLRLRSCCHHHHHVSSG